MCVCVYRLNILFRVTFIERYTIVLGENLLYILINVPRVFLHGGADGMALVSTSFVLPPFRFNCFSIIRALLA